MNDKPIASDYDGSYQYLTDEQKQNVDFIITGNPYSGYGRLYDDGVRIPVFWNPGKEELMDIITHKAEVINKTGASIFYEDQPIQKSMLSALCPKCKVVLVKPNV